MRRILSIVLLAVVVGGGFGIWYWFIRDSAPPKAQLTERSTVAPSDEASGADGTYSVKTDATTFAGLRIDEEFSGIGSHTAVMRTPAVTGSLTVAGTKITGVAVTADLSALESKDSQPPGVFPVANRVGAMQREGLELSKFPTAKFTITGAVTLPEAPTPGKKFVVQAAGELTVHGVTKSVTVPITASWNGEVIDVQGSLEIALADYGMTPPDRGFVKSAAKGTMEFTLLFAR